MLAVEAAAAVLPTFEGDGWLVELASVADAGLVPTAVAGVLGLRLERRHLRRNRRLGPSAAENSCWFSDNCEHVIDAAARLAETVVRRCPGATVLATSREVLRIEGEYVYRVPPLEVPPAQRQEPGHSSDTARCSCSSPGPARWPDFSPDGEQLATIAAICRHLDGIPLAIELAAARAATLGVPQVAARLEDRFGC